MKSQNRVSSLTLELYYRGLATRTERKQVEKALAADSAVRARYEALQESDRAIRRIIDQELNRMNIPARPPAPSPRRKKVIVGLALAAAVLLCALVPVFFFHKDNAIAEETTPEPTIDIPSEDIAVSPELPAGQTEIAESPRTEPPVRSERGNSSDKAEPAKTTEPPLRIEPDSGVPVATAPPPDTGVRLRGGGDPVGNQPSVPAVPEPASNINIPPGITFIFENMFANRDLTFVIIPSRITSIGKNAFAGNPLVSVTIGANVSVEANAIPGAFAAAYNAKGRAAGTYTRPNPHSEAWEKE